MSNSVFIKNLYTKCRIHGTGDAQITISDREIYALIALAIHDLGWSFEKLGVERIELPAPNYYEIGLDWFEKLENVEITPGKILSALEACFNKDQDFALFIENLSALHRRRAKFKRILSSQPIPTMDQIGPRILLEYGACDVDLLANWMTWRKWIYDIDNRSAQETGYLFEPILASSLGGETVGSRNSPIKRLDENGNITNNGRQVDCLISDSNTAYELKLRVTIAASGQGRFGEELSFPIECQAAGYIPILLVLDPTPSSRLTVLSEQYIECGGAFFQGVKAWKHMEKQAGKIMSVFIKKYIKPAIKLVDDLEIKVPKKISLEWFGDSIKISNESVSYTISRKDGG
ncbi:MAG: restriction endonuclease [Anaerolineae bacterium]|nr:restriction endonuclease [Anaerolineae bacterium]